MTPICISIFWYSWESAIDNDTYMYLYILVLLGACNPQIDFFVQEGRLFHPPKRTVGAKASSRHCCGVEILEES